MCQRRQNSFRAFAHIFCYIVILSFIGQGRGRFGGIVPKNVGGFVRITFNHSIKLSKRGGLHMTKYILKRVGYSIVTLFLLVAITFFMMQQYSFFNRERKIFVFYLFISKINMMLHYLIFIVSQCTWFI